MVSCDSLAIYVCGSVLAMWIMFDRSIDLKSGVSLLSSPWGFQDSEDPYALDKIVCETEEVDDDAQRTPRN